MENVKMIEDVKTLLIDRKIENNVINNIGFLVPAGSVLFGTNNEDSDRDYKGIVIPTKEDMFNLKTFEYVKIAQGDGGINLKDDLDVELYSLKKFLNGLLVGNPIEMEMINVPEEMMMINNDILKEIFRRKKEFISKKFIHNYLSMNNGYVKRIEAISTNLKNPLSKKRIETFGFETKNASKALQHLYLLEELFETGEIVLFRKERKKLLDVKNGKYAKKEVMEEILQLTKIIEEKKSFLQIPKIPVYNDVNGMYKEAVKKTLGVC